MSLRTPFIYSKIYSIAKLYFHKRAKSLLQEKLLISIVIVALAIRSIGLVPNLGGHPDESIIYGPALKMVTDPTLVPSNFYYGSLYMYLQAIISLIVRTYLILYTFGTRAIFNHSLDLFSTINQYSYKSIMQGSTPYFDVYLFWGRFLTALLGSVTVVPVFLLGKLFFNKQVGLIAGIILAVSALFTRDSQYITIDVPWAFFTTIAVLFCSYFFLKQDRKNALLAGFFVGLSTSMKYLPIAFPALFMAILLSFENRKKTQWIQNALLAACMVPVGFIAGSPFIPFYFPQFIHDTSYVLGFYGHDLWWHKGGGFQLHFLSGQIKIHQAGFLYEYGLGEIASLFAILGIMSALYNDYKKALILLATPGFVIFFFVFATSTLYTRQVVSSIPFLCLFAGVGVFFAHQLLIKHIKQLKSHRKSVLIMIIFITILPLALKTLPSSYYCGQENSIKKARAWLNEDPPPIPLQSKVAVSYNIAMPSNKPYDSYEMKTQEDYSLANLKEKNREYVLIYDEAVYGFFDWINEYFTIPRSRIAAAPLSTFINELKAKGTVVQNFTKPVDYELCPDYNVYVIKI